MNKTNPVTAEDVERVARALWDAQYPNGTSWDDWEAQKAANPDGFDGRDESRRLARAAIAALSSTPSDTGDELREALTKAIDFLQTAPLESGVCCCGSPVEGHGFGDGHSPVDELRYHASNLAEGLAAALSKAPQATRSEGEIEGWQPIETAPKDGTDILVVHRENRSFLQIVAWEDGETVFKWCSPDGPDYHENAFSHWMPLPEPPARTAGD
jgi:hypothetical protein